MLVRVGPGEKIEEDKLPGGRIVALAAVQDGKAGLCVLDAFGGFADDARVHKGDWLGADELVSFDDDRVRLAEAGQACPFALITAKSCEGTMPLAIYPIREKYVRRFVLEHPSDVDLRNVDQIWFLDTGWRGRRNRSTSPGLVHPFIRFSTSP